MGDRAEKGDVMMEPEVRVMHCEDGRSQAKECRQLLGPGKG